MSQHKYNEWLEKVEIGVWALKWSPQRVFESGLELNLAYPFSTFDTKIEWIKPHLGQSFTISILNG